MAKSGAKQRPRWGHRGGGQKVEVTKGRGRRKEGVSIGQGWQKVWVRHGRWRREVTVGGQKHGMMIASGKLRLGLAFMAPAEEVGRESGE
jgi:hypothetical protein